MPLKLGRKAIKTDSRTLKLSPYMKALAPPPTSVDWTKGITSWGMMMNDTLGDCVVGESIVDSPDAQVGYKSPYNGPIISFRTNSGKCLTVTPNHPMLTNRGWVAAKDIEYGDDLVSTRGSEILPRAGGGAGKLNLYHAPSPIHEIVSTLRLNRGSVRKIAPTPVHFHGDGKFMDGDIEVVGTNGFLGSELNSPLSQPYPENKVGTTRKLQGRFQGFSSSFKRFRISWNSLFGYQGLPLRVAHAGISQFYGLPEGSGYSSIQSNNSFNVSSTNTLFGAKRLDISPRQKSILGTPKDFSDFLGRFSSFVHTDRVVNIDNNSFSGHVYNLSTTEGWYAANGIVTHNCTIAGVGHAIQVFSAETGQETTVPDSVVLDYYEKWDGYVPGDPSTDNGGIELDVLTRWKAQGFNGHTLLAFADPTVGDHGEVMQAINLFGGVYIGMNVPSYIVANSPDIPTVWQVPTSGQDASIEGGHCVFVCGYTAFGVTFISWGQLYQMSWAYWDMFVDEAHCLLSQDWINAKGVDVQGFALAQLQTDLSQIH